MIETGDYDVWTSHFGEHLSAGVGANAAVPEPPTLVLLMFAATGVSTRRLWCAWRVSKLIDA
jgi:hypothetical protein